MSNDVIPMVESGLVVKESPNHLIALALEKQADPDTISKLMDLQERWEAQQARKAYVSAMTGFKQEAPAVLKKGDRVDFTSSKGRTAYNYANLGSIVQEITALLGKHDLSASWTTAQDGGNVTVTCHITHIAGHRESVVLTGPADDSGNKNRIQAVGSTVTYLQRYTLLAALGLATGEDDDGRQGKDAMKAPESKTQSPSDAAGQAEGKKDDTQGDVISEAQAKRFYAIAKGSNWTDEDIHKFLTDFYGIDSSRKILKAQYDEIIDIVKVKKDA